MIGQLHIEQNPEKVAQAFAEFLCNKADGKENFNIALSGGSTPKLLFRILAEDFTDRIDWSKINFYWGDERCVAPTSDESNFKMTNELLFKPLHIELKNIHRVLGESEPEDEASRYAMEILKHVPTHNQLPCFDLIILGMGEDGHTASIFPHQMDLLSADRICDVAVHPTSGQKRITITGPTLNNAKDIAFLLTGAGKKEKVDAIFHRQDGYEQYPAAHINPNQGNLHWFLDEAALPEKY